MDNRNMEEENVSRKTPFTVPEDYFLTLEDKIMERIEEERQPSRRRVSWIQMFKPYMGLTAIFALAFLVVQFVLPHFIDHDRMLVKKEAVVQGEQVRASEPELDTDFNPTREEIIEYLAMEGDMSDLVLLNIRR